MVYVHWFNQESETMGGGHVWYILIHVVDTEKPQADANGMFKSPILNEIWRLSGDSKLF